MKIKKIAYSSMKAENIYMSIDMNFLFTVNKTYGTKNSSINIYKLHNEPGYPTYSSYIKSKTISDITNDKTVMMVYDLGKRSPYKKFDDRLVFSNIEISTRKFIDFIKNI